MDIIFLNPIYKDYIWGGTNLKKKYNKNSKNNNIAESIEIIANKDNSVKVIKRVTYRKGYKYNKIF